MPRSKSQRFLCTHTECSLNIGAKPGTSKIKSFPIKVMKNLTKLYITILVHMSRPRNYVYYVCISIQCASFWRISLNFLTVPGSSHLNVCLERESCRAAQPGTLCNSVIILTSRIQHRAHFGFFRKWAAFYLWKYPMASWCDKSYWKEHVQEIFTISLAFRAISWRQSLFWATLKVSLRLVPY